MNESQFSRDLRKSIESACGQDAWIRKMTGGPFVTPGIPDLIGCIGGKFIGIECKQIKTKPVHKTSKIWDQLFSQAQIDSLLAIKLSGGCAWGIINLAFNNPQTALILPADKIQTFNTATLSALDELIKTEKVLTRIKGVWNFNPLYLLM